MTPCFLSHLLEFSITWFQHKKVLMLGKWFLMADVIAASLSVTM